MPSEVLRSEPDQPATDQTPTPESGPVDNRDEPDRAEELPLDVIFELLQNQRRRRVLRHLEEASETVDIGTLAEELAARENDKPVKALTSSERKRVYICLYQCHLPKMDDTGVIEFDSNRGTITQTDLTALLTTYLDRVTGATTGDATSDSWPARYFGITLVGGGLYFLQAVMYPSALVSHVLMGLVVASLLATSLIHASAR